MHVAKAALLCCGLGAAAAVLPGCYVDDASQRLLGKTICEKTGGCTALTLEYCAAACRALHYGVAGVEYPTSTTKSVLRLTRPKAAPA